MKHSEFELNESFFESDDDTEKTPFNVRMAVHAYVIDYIRSINNQIAEMPNSAAAEVLLERKYAALSMARHFMQGMNLNFKRDIDWGG